MHPLDTKVYLLKRYSPSDPGPLFLRVKVCITNDEMEYLFSVIFT